MNFLPTLPLASNTLFFFGVLLLCGATGGYITHRWPWLPSITGFMLVGLLAGPNVLNLVSYATLAESRVIIDVALGLILYRLGLTLDLKRLIHDRKLLLVSLVESTLTFMVVYGGMLLLQLDSLTAAVIAALAVSSSPAELIHVAHEMGARGPVTERAKSLVALNNVIAFLLFSALLPLLYRQAKAPLATVLGGPAYALLGSILVGVVVGYVLHGAARLTKAAHQYQLALVVGAVSLTLGATLSLKLSPLFAPLVLGIVVRSIEHEDLVADLEFGPAFELFFIALFVYAGANMHLETMLTYAPAIGVFLLGRFFAKWLGAGITSRLQGVPTRQAATVGLLLIPMAGLAIGLVNTTGILFPQESVAVSSIVLAAVAILETIGPPIASKALRWSGDELRPDASYESPPERPDSATAAPSQST